MQRAIALQPLSRDHKSLLMACLLIRKGLGKKAANEVIVDFFLQCWYKEIVPHFEEEEAALVPLLVKYPAGKEFAAAILRDHELLRTSVTHLDQDALNERLIANLADQLEQHIRFEERIVFQQMQEFIPEEILNQLIFPENTQPAICNNYPNHFWE